MVPPRTRAPEPAELAPLPPRGRATRGALPDGAILHRLGPADAALARRVAKLGAAGVFGCEAGGVDDAGPWFLLTPPTPTLRERLEVGALPSAEAIVLFRRLAGALAACEAASLFPGRLRPRDIGGEGTSTFLLAAPLLSAWLGETLATAPEGASLSRWDAPELADGAGASSATNRYALGLVVYNALAGRHPFGGLGLRHAHSASLRDAPPLPEQVAGALSPGVQALLLRVLAPSAADRPASATEIVNRLDELLSPARPSRARVRPATAPSPRPKAARTEPRSGGRGLPRGWAAPLVLGLAGLAALASRAASPPDASAVAAAPPPQPPRPLSVTRAADCAPCHAREVSEWERSVMAHSVKSPLFGALESIVEEQAGRDARCPNGAGLLRRRGAEVCADRRSGVVITGSGGEHWCVNCHAPMEAQSPSVEPWTAFSSPRGRAPLRDVLRPEALEGVSCGACHATVGPVGAHASGARYEGNPTWISTATGALFLARPEDAQGRSGIGNSGYRLEPSSLLGETTGARPHRASSPEALAYRRSSEFCGACHDVRLFGTDAVARSSGDHFKRLRNGYSEWRAWANAEAASGRRAATCQDCHMSLFPGVCLPTSDAGAPGPGCPPGTRLSPRAPGEYATGLVAPSSARPERLYSHTFSSVDVPLTPSFPERFAAGATLDARGVPLGLRARRDMLLARTFRFEVGAARRSGRALEIPIVLENTGAGHRVPAGFSQEREVWVELRVTDGAGREVYQVGGLDDPRADLRDKRFLRITARETSFDSDGRPLGLFGADVADGPDLPEWSPNPRAGGTRFRGKGLINLQNGFLRCVRCIGVIDARGRCQPGPGQGRTRADRYDDGVYDQDTGECRSNLSGGEELFETYFPVGSLDAERGVFKAPDAIVDTRSAPPGAPLEYTYVLDTGARTGPFQVEARLRFRSFPPFLVRAFAAYEEAQAARGARPSGAQVTLDMLERVEVLELARATTRIE